MLSELSIRDIVLIEQLDLQFSEGLSVLTGETGAGKSILLDGLALALGARGDGGLVRKGEKQGSISAVFDLPVTHPSRKLLQDNNLPDEDGLIIRRVQSADGRTRAFVNDSPVSATLMRQIGQSLIEIHGQHDDRAMLDVSTHRSLIDSFGGCGEEVSLVRNAWQQWKQVEEQIRHLAARLEAAQKEADYLRSAAEELTKLAPEAGEETDLADRRQRMMKLEQAATDLVDANELLSGTASPLPTISSLTRTLAGKQEQIPEILDETVENLDQALNALYAAQSSLDRVVRELDFDPKELENCEERLFALRAASRKFGVPVENLPELAVKMADNVSDLETGEEDLRRLKEEGEGLRGAYFSIAGELSRKRQSTGEELSACVMRELPDLKLDAAKFLVQIEPSEDNAGPDGLDSVEFWVQTNPGSNPGPMAKVASGGELSRFMLALKVALAEKGSAPTLVFDEIDTGVGGAVADAIGRRLAKLASSIQVLSVTHAPQVAARANQHFIISKSPDTAGKAVKTGVRFVDTDGRREEIARMLAGATVTDEARAAADQLLNAHG